MDRCTDHHDITEILLKKALNTIQSVNQLIPIYTLKPSEILVNCFFLVKGNDLTKWRTIWTEGQTLRFARSDLDLHGYIFRIPRDMN